MQAIHVPLPDPFAGRNLSPSDAVNGVWHFVDIPEGLRAPAWAKEARVDWCDGYDNPPTVEVRADVRAALDDLFYDLILPNGNEKLGSICHDVRLYHSTALFGEHRWSHMRRHRITFTVRPDMFVAICADLLSHLRLVRVWSYGRWTIEPIKPDWQGPKRAMKRRAM